MQYFFICDNLGSQATTCEGFFKTRIKIRCISNFFFISSFNYMLKEFYPMNETQGWGSFLWVFFLCLSWFWGFVYLCVWGFFVGLFFF